MKKLYLFFVVTSFIIGINVVNDAYIDMTGKESCLFPQCRRIDSEYVQVSGLGQTRLVNVSDIYVKMNQINYQMTTYAKNLVKDVKIRLGVQPDKEETREVYGVQIL